MSYDPESYHRRSIRLKNYEYSQAGLYFITICTQHHTNMFGEICDGRMVLNDAGEMVKLQWLELSHCFATIQLHEFIVMPNHFHGIIEIVGVPLVGTQNTKAGQPEGEFCRKRDSSGGRGIAPRNHHAIGDMVGAFKSITTNLYIDGVKQKQWQPFDKKLWQRNYYEHIIRNEDSHKQIIDYIQHNPLKWEEDKYYSDN